MEQIFSTFEWGLIGSVLFLFIIQLYYCFAVGGRIAFYNLKKRSLTDAKPPVSIILSARNEAEILQHTLPKILSQNYPLFEVIVVNDCSEDDSDILLASLQAVHPHLVYRTIVKDDVFAHSKKMALGLGIKAAQYDLCLFIDADCFPASNEWLAGMQQFFASKTEVVLAYTRLDPKKNARWVRADRFMQALHYLGRAMARRPYMGVGSNMAFRKQLFFDNKGFDMRITKNLREDRIFINQVATAHNTAVAIAPSMTTISTIKITSSLWLLHRCEELRSFALCEKGARYPALFESILRTGYYVLMIMAAILFRNQQAVLFGLLGIELLRAIIMSIVFIKSLRKLGEKGLWFLLMCWHFIYPFVHIALIIVSKFSHKPRK